MLDVNDKGEAIYNRADIAFLKRNDTIKKAVGFKKLESKAQAALGNRLNINWNEVDDADALMTVSTVTQQRLKEIENEMKVIDTSKAKGREKLAKLEEEQKNLQELDSDIGKNFSDEKATTFNIVDIKTAAKNGGEITPTNILQVSAYALAAQKMMQDIKSYGKDVTFKQ